MYTKFESGTCPHCGQEIYKWFVEVNGYCPVDGCHRPVAVSDLLPTVSVTIEEIQHTLV